MYFKQAYGARNCGSHSKRSPGWQQNQQTPGNPWRRPKYNVPINVAEDESNFIVYVFASGFGKEDIKVSVVDDLLYITGNKTIDEENVPKFRRQEFPIKTFERTLALNGQVDTTGIVAKHENGVLIVTLPKSAEAQPLEQDIQVV
jgi:HSP20 family protein